jgi:hypothetical protein
MNKFVHENFQSFKDEFEKEFGCNICEWIRDNIDIKESRNSRSPIEVYNWFACISLLKDPDDRFLNLCDRLFVSTGNRNKRCPHIYLANQVNGYLKEALHAKKLSKLYPDYKIDIITPEFNSDSNKREIYTKPGRFITRGPDLKVTVKNTPINIHIKANNSFLREQKLTLRGGKNPEYQSIKNKEYYVHILVDHSNYISIKNFNQIEKHILKEEILPKNNSWGGEGAVRIHFKPSVLDIARKY